MEGAPGQFEPSTADKPVLGYAQPAPRRARQVRRLPMRTVALFFGCILTPVLAALAGLQALAAYINADALTLGSEERVLVMLTRTSHPLEQPSAVMAVLAVTMAAALVVAALSGLRRIWLRRRDAHPDPRGWRAAGAMLVAAIGYAAIIIPYILNLRAVHRDHVPVGGPSTVTVDLLAVVSAIAILGAVAAAVTYLLTQHPDAAGHDDTDD